MSSKTFRKLSLKKTIRLQISVDETDGNDVTGDHASDVTSPRSPTVISGATSPAVAGLESPGHLYRPFGDPVDVLKYDIKKYNRSISEQEPGTKKEVNLVLMRKVDDAAAIDGNPSELDETDGGEEASDKKSEDGAAKDKEEDHDEDESEGNGSGVEKSKMGFNLMSVTCRRGHFVDDVEKGSIADKSGLKNGDLLLEIGSGGSSGINGAGDQQDVRDLTHDQVVQKLHKMALEGKFGDKIRLVVIPADSDSEALCRNNDECESTCESKSEEPKQKQPE